MAESTFKVDGGIQSTGIITATNFAREGGTSDQFLKGDGTTDSRTFLTSQSDTTYTPSAQDGQSGAKILRLTAGGSGTGDQDITLKPGSNITLTRNNNDITFSSSFTDTDTTYSQAAVVDGNNVKLRLTNSSGIDDDINIISGSNINFGNVTSNGFTISSIDNNTTYSINALDHASNEKKVIRLTDSGNNTDDVILVTPVGSNLTISRTGDEINLQGPKYETSVVDSGVTDKYFIRLSGSGSLTSTDDIHIIGGNNISLSKVSDDITFNSTDTLDSVTDRNPTTTNTVTVGILTVTNGTTVNDLTVNNGVVIKGNLTVEGTTTQIDSTNLNIGDNQIKLNYAHTGAPTQNAGLLVERGSSSDVEIRWNETDDKWQYTNDGTTFKDLGSSAISAADGNVASKKKIVLTDPDSNTDEVILEAGTNMTASRSGDTITFNSSHVTYNYSATDPGGGNVRLNLNDSNAVTDFVQLTAGNNITFTGITDSNITVNADNVMKTNADNTTSGQITINRSTNTSDSATGSTLLTLQNNVGNDLKRQKTFIDFSLIDGNTNFTPQVRIGAEVGEDANADNQSTEGSGAFVVYTSTGTDATNGNLTEKLRVSHNGTCTATKFSGDGIIPTGGIIMWSGTVANIPTGWTLCDGNNSTPDLRNRFVVGVHSDGADSNWPNLAPGHTGGSADAVIVSHTHGSGNYTAGSSGSGHSHTYVDQVGANEGYRPWKAGDNDCGARDKETDTDGTHSHSITGDSGAASGGVSGTDKNLPPYYALCYIMKT